jgi:hypothetical protein
VLNAIGTASTLKEISLPLLKISTNEYNKSVAKKSSKSIDEQDNNNNYNSNEYNAIDNFCKGDLTVEETGQSKRLSSTPIARHLSPINTGLYSILFYYI